VQQGMASPWQDAGLAVTSSRVRLAASEFNGAVHVAVNMKQEGKCSFKN